jgi:hypothetical protein
MGLSMKKSIYALMIAAAAVSGAGQASAAIYDLTSAANYSGTFAVNANGTLSLLGGTTEYTGVQQQDKLWDNFSLHQGEIVSFGFSTIAGVDTHSISIGGNLSSQNPTTVGYNISVNVGPDKILSTASDVVQSAGKSSLSETLTPGGNISFSKNSSVSPPIYTGLTSLTFAAGETSISVLETITPDIKGTNISFIENSFVQSAPGPIPGIGLFGSAALLGFLLTAKARASRG